MPTPHKMGKAPLEVAGSALGANGLPGPSDSVVIPPTATEIAPLPDGFPSAFPGSAPPPSNYPAPAYPPQVYPDSGTTPQDGGTGGGGFEGDIPPPPEAPREWQPEDGAVPPEDTNY